MMQNKLRVHNVELPQWARENPYLYVTKLRKGFEKSVISKNLNLSTCLNFYQIEKRI